MRYTSYGFVFDVERVLRNGTRAAFRKLNESGMTPEQILDGVSRDGRAISGLFDGRDSAEIVLACFYYAVKLCQDNKALHN